MKTLSLGPWVECSAQRCTAEWLFGVFLFLERGHWTLSFGLGPFDLTLDVYLPMEAGA